MSASFEEVNEIKCIESPDNYVNMNDSSIKNTEPNKSTMNLPLPTKQHR